MSQAPTLDFDQVRTLMESMEHTTPLMKDLDPALNTLATEIIGRIADKWTLIILDVLAENGEMRFTRVGEMVKDISQKMLTKTLRQMERDGLVKRTVHPVIPPHVEYKLTDLGTSLSGALCILWVWAMINGEKVNAARRNYDARSTDQ